MLNVGDTVLWTGIPDRIMRKQAGCWHLLPFAFWPQMQDDQLPHTLSPSFPIMKECMPSDCKPKWTLREVASFQTLSHNNIRKASATVLDLKDITAHLCFSANLSFEFRMLEVVLGFMA